ncbi:hypothetical protein LTR12_009432 [Friedmanniomyces endolithicus]|nr:hypothetical protein LTR74_016759 [Friedmanniomyces endolithicus]KAK1816183.1 hypothetical protein LTR12_009432 [Friedmanniomyces endolithicus]
MECLVLPYDEIDRLREDVQFGRTEAVRSFLEVHKADTVPEPLARYSGLMAEAIRHGHVDTLEALLGEGVPVTESSIKAAVEAKSTSILDILFAHGWEINQPLSGSEPPMLSIVLDDAALVSWLLERGADPNATSDLGESPLAVAVNHAPRSTIELLLRHCDNLEAGYLLHYAVQRQPPDIQLINLLVAAGAPMDQILWQDPRALVLRGQFTRGTPLYLACKENQIEVAETLLSLGADPDKKSMQYNVHTGPSPREIIWLDGNVDMIKLFSRAACKDKTRKLPRM